MDKKSFKWIFLLIFWVSALHASNVDHYQILGIDSNATQKEIKTAYQKLAQKYHPDRHPIEDKESVKEIFLQIGEAYETLKDSEKRAAYDASREGKTYDQIRPDNIRSISTPKNILVKMEVPSDLYERLELSLKTANAEKIKRQFNKLSDRLVSEIESNINKIEPEERRGGVDIKAEKLQKLYEAFLILSHPKTKKAYDRVVKDNRGVIFGDKLEIDVQGRVVDVETTQGLKSTIFEFNEKPYFLEGQFLKPRVTAENRSFTDYIPGLRKIFGTNRVDLPTNIELIAQQNLKLKVEVVEVKQIRAPEEKLKAKNRSKTTALSRSTGLAPFSPEELSHREVREIISAFRAPNSLHPYKIKSILKRFPREALMFYAAIGATMVTQDVFWNGFINESQSSDPDYLPTFVEQFTSPVGILSFFSFVVAAGKMNGAIERGLNKILELDNRYSSRARNGTVTKYDRYLKTSRASLGVALKGMRMPLALTAGMFVSNLIHEVAVDEHLKACTKGLFSKNTREEKDYLEHCQLAYMTWGGKVTEEWTPSAVGLVLSAGSAGVLTQSIGALYKSASKAASNLMAKKNVNIPSWKMAGRFSSFLGKSSGITSIGVGFFHLIAFFELNTYLFDPYVVQPWTKRNVAKKIIHIKDDIRTTFKESLSSDEFNRRYCDEVKFENLSWFDSVTKIFKNFSPDKRCTSSYLQYLITKYDFNMDQWRAKQLGVFAYARMSWNKSISQAKRTYQYVDEFLELKKELKNERRAIPAYHNIRDKNPSRIDRLIPENKIETVISQIEQYLRGQDVICDDIVNDRNLDIDRENNGFVFSNYPFFQKNSEDFFKENNNDRNLCYVVQLLKVDEDSFFESNGEPKMELDMKGNTTVDDKILQVTAGFQLILQWITEEFSKAEKFHESFKNNLSYNYPSNTIPIAISAITAKTTPMSDLLLSLKDTLAENNGSPFIYSTPKAFVDLSNEIKKESKSIKDEQTWSDNVFFTQNIGLEQIVKNMVCGEDISEEDISDVSSECHTPRDMARLAQMLPSFDKMAKGPYKFKIPRLFNIPDEAREKICEQQVSFYNIDIKGYDNLLDFLLEYNIDENTRENIEKQYEVMMKCFDRSYKQMYKTKLKPMIDSKEEYSVNINGEEKSAPKGTYESIKSQMRFYVDLLKTDEDNFLKRDIERRMDNFYNNCSQKECTDEYYEGVLSILEENFSLDKDDNCFTFDFNQYQMFYLYGACSSISEMSATDKDKSLLMIIHGIMKLQTKVIQLKEEVSVADQIALPSM